jgi:hypothetical protein
MKYIYTLLICTCLTACGGDAFDSEICRRSVQNTYHTKDVFLVPEKQFSFIVRKPDGTVLIAKTLDRDSTKVTKEVVLFEAIK